MIRTEYRRLRIACQSRPRLRRSGFSARSAGLNAAALEEISLPELLTELAQRKALIARVTVAAVAIGIAPRVIK